MTNMESKTFDSFSLITAELAFRPVHRTHMSFQCWSVKYRKLALVTCYQLSFISVGFSQMSLQFVQLFGLELAMRTLLVNYDTLMSLLLVLPYEVLDIGLVRTKTAFVILVSRSVVIFLMLQ